MLQSPHFTRAPIADRPGYKAFFGDIRHVECGTTVPVMVQGKNFQDMTWTFSWKCPKCETLGGTGQWDSLPITNPIATALKGAA